MKIEYESSTNLTSLIILCVVTLVILIIFEIVTYIVNGFNMNFVVLICLNVLIITLVILAIYDKKKITIEKIKNKGTKMQAFITATGVRNKNRQRGIWYYLCIRYSEKNMKIFVKNNETFKILYLLLKPYPINKKIEIPVDMYIYKGNRYVDIENVNLTKIEGYSEAEKIVREMEKEEI